MTDHHVVEPTAVTLGRELGRAAPKRQLQRGSSAKVRGQHYTQWPKAIGDLKRDGEFEEALDVLYECIGAAEFDRHGREPAPWYTTQAAILHRQLKQHAEEIAVIERWLRVGKGPHEPKLRARLAKALQLREQQLLAQQRRRIQEPP